MTAPARHFFLGGRRLFLVLLLAGLTLNVPGQVLLTNVPAVRSLSREQAAQRLPVKVRGVVAHNYRGAWQNIICNDGTMGIWVDFTTARKFGFLKSNDGLPKFWKRGMLVEIEGVTDPGGFAPVILPTRAKVVGTNDLPAPTSVTLPQLMNGRFDCQLVAIEGVIQRVDKIPDTEYGEDNVQILVVTEGGGHFTVLAPEPDGFEAAELVDSLARFTGNALGFWNARGEQLGVRMQIIDRGDVKVLRPPLKDPFAIPLSNPYNLKNFASDLANLHRQRISGVVTLVRPGEFLYLQTGDRAVRVTTSQTQPLTVGDQVEAVGFVEISHNYAELREAIYRRTGRASEPEPLALDWERANRIVPEASREVQPSDLDGRLVSIECRLESIDATPLKPVQLYLENQGHIFTASVVDDVPGLPVTNFRPGSVLKVTGICLTSLSSEWPALRKAAIKGFNLLLRSPADIQLIQPAPWWTSARLIAALTITGLMLAVFLMWTLLLRRTVAKQAAKIITEQQSRHDAEVEFKATLRERSRLAADLHDTVEQHITAATYQLEIERAQRVNPADDAAQRADMIYDLLNRGRDDLRRSLWALRTGILEGRTFDEALSELVGRTERTNKVACTCQLETDGTRVPEFEASHLLLIAQEAVHNALKHAQPKTIAITGKITAQNVQLAVADDGKGFDLKRAPGSKDGHFGLLGMKERLAALNGQLSIQSAPGQGTRIEMTIPLNPTARENS